MLIIVSWESNSPVSMCLASAPPACKSNTLSVMARTEHPSNDSGPMSLTSKLYAMQSMNTHALGVCCVHGFTAHCTAERHDMHQEKLVMDKSCVGIEIPTTTHARVRLAKCSLMARPTARMTCVMRMSASSMATQKL